MLCRCNEVLQVRLGLLCKPKNARVEDSIDLSTATLGFALSDTTIIFSFMPFEAEPSEPSREYIFFLLSRLMLYVVLGVGVKLMRKLTRRGFRTPPPPAKVSTLGCATYALPQSNSGRWRIDLARWALRIPERYQAFIPATQKKKQRDSSTYVRQHNERQPLDTTARSISPLPMPPLNCFQLFAKDLALAGHAWPKRYQ